MAAASERVQIQLSALSITAGATLVWLLLTFLFGRVYCSTVCPIGYFSDLFYKLRRREPDTAGAMQFRHKSRFAKHIFWIYAICVACGIVAVPFILEPWNIARNMTCGLREATISQTWLTVGLGVGSGLTAGIVSGLFIALTSLWRGREFCTRYCPIGTGLGVIAERAAYHIEIDPDRCTSCGKCEAGCRSSCIKVVSRYVDNSRCVRCFDCVANCPEDAIRFQNNRNRGATPLMRRKRSLN